MNCWLIAVSVVTWTTLNAGEQPPIFNLREVVPQAVTVAGKQVLLVVTGAPPHVLAFTNVAASKLKRRGERDPKSLQVNYGKDVVGFARVLVSRSDPKAEIISVSLKFETDEQAGAAGKALRPGNTAPSPLQRQRDESSAGKMPAAP